MTDLITDYTPHYRWEWFRRADWRQSFRERKRHSTGAFVEVVRERGMTGEPVLDCSCGLGLKTIVMREAGLRVHGSDQCELAVEYARQLAREEGIPDIPYTVSSWSELPRRTGAQYAAIFNDALSWICSDQEMADSLKGLYDCLRPGGVLAYMGALPGTDGTDRQELLEQQWRKRTINGKHVPGLFAFDGETSVQEAISFDKGPDFIDEHHLYMINEVGVRRVETWCLRCCLKWSWPRIFHFLKEAGFSSFDTKQFVAANGNPFHLVLAER